MPATGTLYLIPTPLGPEGDTVLPAYVIEAIHRLDVFIVEKAKTARRFISGQQHPRPISELTIFELNKKTEAHEWPQFLRAAETGTDTGLLSEAGCPGVADPGAEIVQLAHQRGIPVVPLVGPSSILLSLMASGLNGQSFTFHGYLSPKRELIGRDLKKLEQQAKRLRQTQIFIETPYRNGQIFEQALKQLHADTRFCVATDLTLPTESIRTLTIRQWRLQAIPDFHKRPTVFLLL